MPDELSHKGIKMNLKFSAWPVALAFLIMGCEKDPAKPEPNYYSVPASPSNGQYQKVYSGDTLIAITLDWHDNSDNEDGFEVEWVNYSNHWSNRLPANSTHYDSRDWNSPAGAFRHRIYAVNRGGKSAPLIMETP